MLKSLVIRQVFMLLDLILALLLVVILFRLVSQVFREPLALQLSQETESPNVDVEGLLAAINPRTYYDPIIANGLFGPAALGKQPESTEPESLPEEKVVSELPLKLWGTVTASNNDGLAAAVVENRDVRLIDTYKVGDYIMEKIKLLEVSPGKVLLYNERDKRKEILLQEEEIDPTSELQNRSKQLPPPKPESSPNRFTLNREEVMTELTENYTDLATKLRPEMYTDEEGNVAGLKINNTSDVELAQKLGLQDGDIVQSVNNEAIDSEEKILELVNKYRDASTFRVRVLRDGKPTLLTYRME